MKGLKTAIIWVVSIVLIFAILIGLASINGLKVTRTAITVGDSVITKAELEFYVEMAKQQVLQEQGIADEEAAKKFLKEGKVDGKAAKDYIRELAVENAIETEKVVALAKKEKITLTDDERSAARSTEGMEDTLKELGVSKDVWSTVGEKEALANKFYSSIYENKPEIAEVTDEAVAEKLADYALVQHVLIKNTPEANDDSTVPETEGYAEAAKEEAERILKRALNGEDFATLVETYGEDPGMESNPDGYLIDKDGYTLDGSQMMQEFTDGAFAVSAGEVNAQLVETSYGYHIIKRCVIEKKPEATEAPVEGEEITTETADPYQQIKDVVVADKVKEYVDNLAKDLKIDKNEKIIKKLKVEY